MVIYIITLSWWSTFFVNDVVHTLRSLYDEFKRLPSPITCKTMLAPVTNLSLGKLQGSGCCCHDVCLEKNVPQPKNLFIILATKQEVNKPGAYQTATHSVKKNLEKQCILKSFFTTKPPCACVFSVISLQGVNNEYL